MSPREKADAWLDSQWRDLRDDGRFAFAYGGVALAEAAGIFDAEHAELWRRRLTTCPGHDDEGGRNWCSFGCIVAAEEGERALAEAEER